MHWTIQMSRRPSLDLHSHTIYFSRSINNQPGQQQLFQTRLYSQLGNNYIIWRSSARAALIVSTVYTFRPPLRPFSPQHAQKNTSTYPAVGHFVCIHRARRAQLVLSVLCDTQGTQWKGLHSVQTLVVSREICTCRLAIAFRFEIINIPLNKSSYCVYRSWCFAICFDWFRSTSKFEHAHSKITNTKNANYGYEP